MHGGGGRDLGLGDGQARRLEGLGLATSPAHAPQHVLAGQQVALLQPGGHQGGEAAPQVLDHRGGGRLVEHGLEVQPGHAPAGETGQHRQDVAAAVAGLLVPVALGPAGHPGRAPGRVEVVGHQLGSGGPDPFNQPEHEAHRWGQIR